MKPYAAGPCVLYALHFMHSSPSPWYLLLPSIAHTHDRKHAYAGHVTLRVARFLPSNAIGHAIAWCVWCCGCLLLERQEQSGSHAHKDAPQQHHPRGAMALFMRARRRDEESKSSSWSLARTRASLVVAIVLCVAEHTQILRTHVHRKYICRACVFVYSVSYTSIESSLNTERVPWT